MSLITHLTSTSQLDSLIAAKKDKLVVIDFHATWCGPCHAIAPTYEKLSKQYAGVATFTKVDVDAAKDVAQKYSVRAMPTFVFLKNGSKVDEVKGANAGAIEAALKRHTTGISSGPSFPGQGHSLSGSTVAPPPPPGQIIDRRVMIGTLIFLAIWMWWSNSGGETKVPADFNEDALY